MLRGFMAGLTVLVMASVAFAAYPSNHPCLVTQKLDPVTGVVTSVAPEQTVAPDQRVASLAGGVTLAASEQKVAAVSGGVSSSDPVNCPPSYFGAQDADRRIAPESGPGGGAASGTD